MFIEIKETEPVTAEKAIGEKQAEISTIASLIHKFHFHPITVHTPNGVLPVSVLFLAIAMIFNSDGFATASFYNLAFVLMVMPAVLYTGYVEWKTRYQGLKSLLFITKISCGFVVLVSALVLLAWRTVNPDVSYGSDRYLFFLIHLIMLAAAGIAGHLGGKLVFKD
jgi:uncharacterized membrane protein